MRCNLSTLVVEMRPKAVIYYNYTISKNDQI